MQCCHLDICMENIMISAKFIETKDSILIDRNISVKFCDFGVSEVYSLNFLCSKHGLSLDNEGISAPKVFAGDVYDARSADIWSLGMVLFQCLTVGDRLYGPLDIYHKMDSYQPKSGYWALHHHKLKAYLHASNLLNYFNVHTFSLLTGLL